MGTTYKELFKLYDLIQNGDSRAVKRFLTDTPTNINVVLPCKGISVLHLAIGVDPIVKSKECTEILLRNGGDPNICNDDGITPVHIAAIWGRVDNLKLLLGCGGDPSRRDIDGHSAFDYAAREEQWDVYDYLHNVVDELDDSGSKCGYTLDLERVLVTTDQMVAEYEPINEEQTQTTSCRKSEMTREWCEKNSLIVNKLYPTIHGETFTIAEYEKSINFTKNMTLDLTDRLSEQHVQNETNNSFKTCLSNRDIVISGIEHLDITSDRTSSRFSEINNIRLDETYNVNNTQHVDLTSDRCNFKTNDRQAINTSSGKTNSNPSMLNQRISVYENFSLPGSPNNVTHKNYHTKTSLKKSRELSSEESHSKNSLISSDSELDKVLAVVQNRTNEWLSSSCEDKACNTRRSSASSGVSSNYSGGSIALASVSEEFRYKDAEEDVVFIEKRLRVSPIVLQVDDNIDSSPDQTVLSVASSLPTSVQYDNNTLRAELMKLGYTPGPIQECTKRLYLKKLQALRKTPILVSKQGKTYSIELEKSLRTDEWMKNLTPYMELETKVRTDFSNPNKKWREGTAKTSFTYLLLDPRLTSNLPEKAGNQNQHISWVTFVNSIFYVGKGKRSRPYSHLYQALTLWKRDFRTSKDKKVQHILDIWTDKVGVICLHIFQNVIPAEAYTYEAAMIDVLGVANLKNLKNGNYYGVAASWPLKERKMLGMYLLYKAMLIFLSEGERQLRPDDID